MAVNQPVSAIQLDRDNPWPGLASYDESSQSFFSGRAAEIEELVRRIVSEPTTVLFGKSGLGKTSLLKAGVFPALREKGLLPILLRLQVRRDAPPLIEQVRLALFAELQAQQIEFPAANADETLWEYLHREGLKFWTRTNWPVRPLFVFDQFEEVFTLGRGMSDAIDRFREDLSDLAENRIPQALARRLGDRPAAEAGQDVQAMPFKIVLSLREDYLADLEEWRLTMPSLRRNRMRLLPMAPEEAIGAVRNEHTRHLVTEPIARQIVAFLATGAGEASSSGPGNPTVEPALLSLFCHGVNEQRKRQQKAQIDDALVEGGKGTIVADFYRLSVSDQPDRVRTFIEEQLITEQGFRNSYAIADAVGRGVVTRAELDALINRHLLRHEHHLGADRVELTHDLLTKAVVDERDRRRAALQLTVVRRQRYRLMVAGAVVTAIAAGFAVLAWSAMNARREAESREYAALAEFELTTSPERAVALAAEGLRRAETLQARSALMHAAQFAWPSFTIEGESLRGRPIALSMNADGTRLAVLSDKGAVTAWDITTNPPANLWKGRDVTIDGANAVVFSPDQSLIAVGSSPTIHLLDAGTGATTRELTPARDQFDMPGEFGDQVVFSPDGQWLAAYLRDERVQRWDVQQGSTEAIQSGPLTLFALLRGGTRIIGVDTNLDSYQIDREPTGKWTLSAMDPKQCFRQQSVSPGPHQWSVTWRAGACIYEATDPSRGRRSRLDRPTDDIVWSSGGLAFAEFVRFEQSVQELIVGTEHASHRLENRIKGVFTEDDSNRVRLVSFSEDATRAAMLEAPPGKPARVRVYSIFEYKPFFSQLDADSLYVAPDATWLATTRSALDPDNPTTIDIVTLDQRFPADRLPIARRHLVVDAPPESIEAALDSLLLLGKEEPFPVTTVYDSLTGMVRYRREGRARPLGSMGELLLFPATSTEPWRIVSTRDGQPIAGLTAIVPPTTMFVARSFRGNVVAVIRNDAATGGRGDVYEVRDGALRKLREIGLTGDPRLWRSIDVTEDGQRLIAGVRSWSLPKEPAAAPSSAPNEEAADDSDVRKSPTGKFQIRYRADEAVVERADGTRLLTLPADLRAPSENPLFSSDDRWLAIWRGRDVEIRDLERNEVAYKFTLDAPNADATIDTVAFIAGNTVMDIRYEDSAMLIPLDRALMDRFAAWLAPGPVAPR